MENSQDAFCCHFVVAVALVVGERGVLAFLGETDGFLLA